jgi:hypothetical protein
MALLICSIVQELELRSSDLWHIYYTRHGRTVCPWVPASPIVQENSSPHKIGPIPRLARSCRNPCRNRQRLPGLPSSSQLEVQLGTPRSHSTHGDSLRANLVLEMATRLQEEPIRKCIRFRWIPEPTMEFWPVEQQYRFREL